MFPRPLARTGKTKKNPPPAPVFRHPVLAFFVVPGESGLVRLLLFLLMLGGSLGAQEDPVPLKPPDHILDLTGEAEDADRASYGLELELAAEKSGLGVYLVLLERVPAEPAAELAGRLAREWTGFPDRAVVLSCPGREPVVAMAGEALDAVTEDRLKATGAEALAAARRAGSGLPGLMAAGRSLIAQMEVFRAGGSLGPPPGIVSLDTAESGGQVTAWITGGALFCCVAALILRQRSRRPALVFPPHEFRRRFSAPHSGGNDASISFGKEK